MLYFITSSMRTLLKINGELIDEIDNNLYAFEQKEEFYIEIIALNPDYEPMLFKIEKNTTKNKSIKLFKLKKGILIMPLFSLKASKNFKSIDYGEQNGIKFHLFNDGLCKIYIQTQKACNIFNLPFFATGSESVFLKNALLLRIFNDKNNALFAFDLTDDICIKWINYNCFFSSNKKDIIQKNSNLTRIYKRLTFDDFGTITQEKFERNRAITQLNPCLIPFAFLEEVLLKCNFCDYLHPLLLPHKKMILSFLGDFYCFIPFNKERETSAILIGESAKEITFYLKDNLINDLTIN